MLCWEWQLLWLVGGFSKSNNEAPLWFATFLWADISAIVCGMRRYSLFITLLLSLLLPLHVAASTVLSAQTCPAKSVMATDAPSNKAAPDCCDESTKKMDCQQMQSCHGCNVSCQLFAPVTTTFHVSSDSNLHVSLNTPALGLFNPASVWRPPTNS